MDSSKIYTYWDHTFAWTPHHQTREQLRSKMHTYDRLGDECIDQINDIGRQVVNQDRQNNLDRKLPDLDVYIMLKDHAKDDPKLSELWAQVNTVPDWVDWQQIKRGQEVFFRYGLPILNVVSLASNLVTTPSINTDKCQLNFESLLGGMLVTLRNFHQATAYSYLGAHQVSLRP